MKFAGFLSVAAVLLLGACDRHEWEGEDLNGDGKIDQEDSYERGTKVLYEHHGDDHGKGHGDDHGKGHGDKAHGDDHGGDKKHADEKAH